MKLVGSTKSKIIKNKDDENVPHVEITESLLVHCDIFNNDYQRKSRFLYAFVASKLFRQLLDISLEFFLFLKIFNLE